MLGCSPCPPIRTPGAAGRSGVAQRAGGCHLRQIRSGPARLPGVRGVGRVRGDDPADHVLAHPRARVRRSALLRPVVRGPLRVNRSTLVIGQLAGTVGVNDRALRHVVEDVVARDLGSWDELRDLAVRLTNRRVRGAPRLVALLEEQADDDGVPMSALERLMADTFGVPCLPPLRWQRPFPWRPAAPQRLDALIEPARVILEGDGRAWHARLEQMGIDRRRDREAMAHGFVVARYGYHEVRDDGPALLEELRTIVADRLPPSRVGGQCR